MQLKYYFLPAPNSVGSEEELNPRGLNHVMQTWNTIGSPVLQLNLMHFIKVSNHIHPHFVLSKTKVSVKCNNYKSIVNCYIFQSIIIGDAIKYKDIDDIVFVYK